MPPTIEQLQSDLEELRTEFDSLKSASAIPLEIDQAFRSRLSSSLGVLVSAKGLNTEDQAVNEAGSGTYDVLGDPDGFLEIQIAATTYHLPYYL